MLHDLLQYVLNWSYRSAMRAAQKLPTEWEILCEETHGCIVYTIKINGVRTAALVVNADQAGQGLMPTGKKTWAERGARQVSTHGHGEKRQMTLVVASACNGQMLPFQSVWGGVSADSLPSPRAPRWEEAKKLGFTFAHGDKRHWSSRASTKAWVKDILLPYHARVCQENGYPEDEPMILLLDVWPVHIAKSSPDDFLPWLQRTYPWIHPIFIPGGCAC
ncbi:hypothetical protein AURDEDRAFT_74619 [Auricularia subglabra TFB-10046 SS5]|nr:hypothetical protein AURDEDRAFT_74619 [Auricularia subglabra TFB-10046 SS5]